MPVIGSKQLKPGRCRRPQPEEEFSFLFNARKAFLEASSTVKGCCVAQERHARRVRLGAAAGP